MAGDSGISPLTIHTLYKVGALSKRGVSLPFHAGRDGFVIGEGGGAVVLETEEHALARGAVIFGELLGCANNTDAYNPVSPSPNGNGAAACMRLALAQAEVSPADIGYVNAHGTATLAGDAAESKAIRQVFGDYAVPVSSTKGATGHMMGAGGITELVACIKAMETGLLPPNLHAEGQDEACSLNLVVTPSGHKPIRIAMSNALGFGGQNSSVIVGKYSE
jgi:3-oxoacyl-[acyl-carrier-protein] synthase II